MTSISNCIWCGGYFAPRLSGGSAQRFCSSSCRQSFHTASRRWVSAAVEAGVISIESLKHSETPCTLVTGVSSGSLAPDPRGAA